MTDSQHNVVEFRQEVRYHGSITEAHGTWKFANYCCYECMPIVPGDEPLPEARFMLYRLNSHGQVEQKLEHVPGDDFTALPAPAEPRPQAEEPAAASQDNR